MKKFILLFTVLITGLSITFGQSITIDISSTSTKIETALTSTAVGSATDVTVTLPAGYAAYSTTTGVDLTTASVPTTIQSLTIKPLSGTLAFNMSNMKIPAATAALRTLIFQNLSLTGTVTSYIMNTAAGNLTDLKFLNCSFTDYRGGIVFAGASAAAITISNITFDNCIVKNIWDYGFVNYVGSTKGTFNKLTITNSSLYGHYDGIQVGGLATGALVDIENCTLEALCMRSGAGKTFVAAGAAAITVKNCILGRIGFNDGTYSSLSGQKGFSTTGTITSLNNYYTTDWSVASNNLSSGLTAYSGAGTSLFNSPTTCYPVVTTQGATTNGTTTVTLSASNSSIASGQLVTGMSTVPKELTVSAYTAGATTFTLSATATGSSTSGTLSFRSRTSSTGDYSIKDANFAGKVTAGNPSCYYPETVLLNGGSSNISLSALSYVEGSGPSATTSFTISAYVPRSVITLTAPAGYEISVNGGTNYYDSSSPVSLGTVNTDLNSTTVLVRLKTGLTNAGSPYNGNITVATSTGTSKTVACSGTIGAASTPTLNTPAKPTSSSVTSRGFHATWSAVSNANKYDLKLYQGGSSSTISDIATTSYDISGLTGGTDYTFTITAKANSGYNPSLESTPSDVISTPNITLTTSVSSNNGAGTGGTVSASPSQSYYNTVGATVSLTATRGFGYQFVKWVDANNGGADLSTANPYTNIAMNSSQNIQAVFQSVATYNFTLNTAGTGATWGSVTVSPAANGGKYETGTAVTLTPVSNLVSTFSQWEDASSTSPRSITVTGDGTYTATFTANPFISAWDFNAGNAARSARIGDYYYNSGNKGTMRFYETTGTETSWGSSTVASKTCARRWTTSADIAAGKCRSFRADISTKGYKSLQLSSKVAYDNNQVNTIQKVQFSTDGTNYSDLATLDFTGKSTTTWYALNASLPASADNATVIYIRWIGDVTSGTMSGAPSGTTEGFYLTDVVVSGSLLTASTASGDYIATTSGDVSTAANWSVSGGSFGISGNAVSAPTSSTNLVIPAGITMTNSASASCNGLQIRGNYTASSPLTVAGNLVIKSDVDGTASIITNGNIAVTGTTTVQQYLKDARNWYVSSPVSNATAPSGYTYYQYDETGNHPSAVGPYWFAVSPGAPLIPGVGYIALPNTAGSTLEFATPVGGTLNAGDIDVTLTKSGVLKTGYNLIGNPYPAHLTWTQTFVDNNAVKIDPTIWYRTNAGTTNASGQWSFLTYNGHTGEGVPAGTTGVIPPMQAFWVKALSEGKLTLSSNLTQSHQVSNPLKVATSIRSERQRLRLQISSKKATDETLIYFDADAQNTLDAYDSPKMSNNSASIPEIYTVVANEKMVMNGLQITDQQVEMPLGYTIGQQDTLTIKATQISGFDADKIISLKDNVTGITTDLTAGQDYSFVTTSANTTDRFTVLFKTNSVATNTTNQNESLISIFNLKNNIHVTCPALQSGYASLNVFNALGQSVYNVRLTEGENILNTGLPVGVYTVRIETTNIRLSKKLIINQII